jgi:hypothetical protein
MAKPDDVYGLLAPPSRNAFQHAHTPMYGEDEVPMTVQMPQMSAVLTPVPEVWTGLESNRTGDSGPDSERETE